MQRTGFVLATLAAADLCSSACGGHPEATSDEATSDAGDSARPASDTRYVFEGPAKTGPWARSLGGTAFLAPRVAYDSDRNVIVAFTPDATSRTFGGKEFNCGNGRLDAVLVVKFSHHDEHLWTNCITGTAMTGAGLAVDGSGNIIVLSEFLSGRTIRLHKLTPSGSLQWSKNFVGQHGARAASVAVDATGDIVFSGSSTGQMNFGAGLVGKPAFSYFVFVARLDAGGSPLWVKPYGDTCKCRIDPPNVAIGPSGKIALAGSVIGAGTLDLGGGATTYPKPGGMYVALLDAGGKHLWTRALVGSSWPGVEDVTLGGGDTVAIVGETGELKMPDGSSIKANNNGVTAAFVATFNGVGSYGFSRTWARIRPRQGGGGEDAPPGDGPFPSAGLASRKVGEVTVASSTLPLFVPASLGSAYFSSFDSAGKTISPGGWMLDTNSSSGQFGTAVAFSKIDSVDDAQSVAVAGIFSHQIKFEFTTLTDEKSQWPAFVADFGP